MKIDDKDMHGFLKRIEVINEQKEKIKKARIKLRIFINEKKQFWNFLTQKYKLDSNKLYKFDKKNNKLIPWKEKND